MDGQGNLLQLLVVQLLGDLVTDEQVRVHVVLHAKVHVEQWLSVVVHALRATRTKQLIW